MTEKNRYRNRPDYDSDDFNLDEYIDEKSKGKSKLEEEKKTSDSGKKRFRNTAIFVVATIAFLNIARFDPIRDFASNIYNAAFGNKRFYCCVSRV